MSLWTYRKAVLESDLPSTLKLVLLVLDNHVNDMGDPCFPAYSRIARLSSLSRRSVIMQINLAEEHGWITIVRRPKKCGQRQQTNLFYLSLPRGDMKSNLGSLARIGEQGSSMHHAHPDGECYSPTLVNQAHPERTSTELPIEPLHSGDLGGGELILPKSVSDAERKIIADLLNDELSMSVDVKQQILDELAGAIATKSIRRGNIVFVRSLIRAERLGTFKPHLGLAVLASRESIIRHAENKRISIDHAKSALDPEAMEKGARLLSDFGLKAKPNLVEE